MKRLMEMIGFNGEAKVEYFANDFHTTSPGSFVKCAVTGKHIPLEELRYWSVELQEAYSSPEVSLKRYLETRKKEK